jgi:quercetin dioxygenase-like cupin family protein
MQALPLQTTIGAGKEKQIDQLFSGPRRRIVQITLRNGAILAAHKAPVPITIQCVAGQGTLIAGESIELTPGILVTLEPNVEHEVRGLPDVSILLTQFTGA